MPLAALDHVNLRTTRLAEMCTFYCDVLGLVRGPRPPFEFRGAWLYCGARPCVHLVEVTETLGVREGQPSLSHFAFTATHAEELLARLGRAGVPYRVVALPGTNVKQVNFADPEGNALHVDFTGEVVPR